MATLEQVKIDRTRTTATDAGAHSDMGDYETSAGKEPLRDQPCRTIELFTSQDVARRQEQAAKKQRKFLTLTEGLTILMLTATVSIALFAAIGYLCQ